ncbi:MAG: cupin domain-containing protein [Anaerolineae bacterium]
MGSAPFVYLPDVAGMVNVVPDGILSRTVSKTDKVTAVVFSFGAGQELSEHTSAKAAIIQVLQGKAEISLGGETFEAGPGSLIEMTPNLTHRVLAVTDMVMLLLLLQ